MDWLVGTTTSVGLLKTYAATKGHLNFENSLIPHFFFTATQHPLLPQPDMCLQRDEHYYSHHATAHDTATCTPLPRTTFCSGFRAPVERREGRRREGQEKKAQRRGEEETDAFPFYHASCCRTFPHRHATTAFPALDITCAFCMACIVVVVAFHQA